MTGYIFTGWSNDKGEVFTDIPVGTVGDITLYDNWMSKRNMTRPVTSLKAPVINHDEANNSIQFAYEIGIIENVPIYTIEDLGNKVDGITFEKTVSSTGTISKTQSNTIVETVANATTRTSTWSLSKDWNDIISLSEMHSNEVEASSSKAESLSTNKSGEFVIGSNSGGSYTHTSSTGITSKVGCELGVEDSEVIPIKASISAEIGAEQSVTDESSRTWNTNVGFTKAASVSKDVTTTNSLINKISNSVNYNISRSVGGTESLGTDLTTSSTKSRECSSSFTYFTETTETSSITISNADAPEGYLLVIS